MQTKYRHIIFTLMLVISGNYVYCQDTLTLEIYKTVGGCPLNHPNKEIVFARTNCGIEPLIGEDSVLYFNRVFGTKVIIVNYFGVLKEGKPPVKYKTKQYTMLNGHVDYRSEIVFHPNYPVYIVSTATDSISTVIRYFQNGQKDEERITFHPNGQKYETGDTSVICFETYFSEDGSYAAKYRYQGGALNGDYFMYDDSAFVTHWFFRNGQLTDVLNTNCRFLNEKGNLISKEEFFQQMNTHEFGQWAYYLFENREPFTKLECIDYLMHSDKWMVPEEGKKAEKLVKRLHKTCP